jgi:exosome complex component RRP43
MNIASAEGMKSNNSSNGKTSMPTEASVLESFVRRTLLQSGIVELSDLCIQEGKSAWKILISIVCLNHDGNMEDAAFLSAVTALSNTQLPRIVISSQGIVYLKDVDDNRNNTTDDTMKLAVDSFDKSTLKLRCIPVPLSIGMFDGKLLVDPSGEEELVLDGILTLIVTSQGQVVSINKPGGAFISSEDLAACLTLATARAKEIEDAIFKL